MKNILKKIFTQTCVIFSIILLLICTGISLIGIEKGSYIDHLSVFALFIISFVISCTNAIYTSSSLPSGVKYLIHLAVVLSAAAIFMKVVNGLSGSTILVAEILVTIIHASTFIIIHLIKKSKAKPEEYKSVYNKNKS